MWQVGLAAVPKPQSRPQRDAAVGCHGSSVSHPNHQVLASVAAAATVENLKQQTTLRGRCALATWGAKRKVTPATRGAVAVGATEGQGSQALQVFLYRPNPGSQARVPRVKAPPNPGTVRVTAPGCRGSSEAAGSGSPAHRHQPGRGSRRARGLRWAARGAWARQAVEGSAEAGTPERAGAELIKARRRAQGESRRVAVRPSAALREPPGVPPGAG